MRNWKKPLGLVPEITLITLLSADPIRFGNEKAFITGILASATVHFAMAICFYANYAKSLCLPLSPIPQFCTFSTELSSVWFLRRCTLLQERSFRILPLSFTWGFFFLLCVSSLSITSVKLVRSIPVVFYEFLWISDGFGGQEWPSWPTNSCIAVMRTWGEILRMALTLEAGCFSI